MIKKDKLLELVQLNEELYTQKQVVLNKVFNILGISKRQVQDYFICDNEENVYELCVDVLVDNNYIDLDILYDFIVLLEVEKSYVY